MSESPTRPPDRAHVRTEHRNPRTADLHALSVEACVARIQSEDRAVLDALDDARPDLVAFIEAAAPGFVGGGRLIYFGAGTSGRLGVLDASEAPPTFQVSPERVIGLIAGGDGSLRKSSEGLEDDPDGAIPELAALELTGRDAVIGIASGGTTPYVRGGLAWVAALPDAPVAAFLTCTDIDAPAGVVHRLLLPTGPEVLTGSTRMKAGTATKLALNTISTVLMIRAGRVYENLMVDVRATNDKLRDRAARIIASLTDLDREASFDLLGRAGDDVKTAIVMHRLGVSRDDARTRLATAQGRLDAALGDGGDACPD